MKILTWNINGIRAGTVKTAGRGPASSFKRMLDSLDADIVSLQETKVTRDQLEETVAIVDGYTSYFSFCRVRTGYSGVATYCRSGCTPVKAEEGLTGVLKNRTLTVTDDIGCYGKLNEWSERDKQSVDSEGRAVLTEHLLPCGGTVVMVNVYCPCTRPEDAERLDYKITFYRALEERCAALRSAGKLVIVLGDVNCSHQPIDICDFDYAEFDLFRNRASVQWLDNFLITESLKTEAESAESNVIDSPQDNENTRGGVVVDTFRYFHPKRENAYTCWSNVTGARKTNYGTRIDYILTDPGLLQSVVECDILPEVEGSDHCPVYICFKEMWLPAERAPSLCSLNMPEFAGRQQAITSFFTRGHSTQAKATNEQRVAQEAVDGIAAVPVKRTSLEPLASGSKKICKPGSQLGKSKSQQASLMGFLSHGSRISAEQQSNPSLANSTVKGEKDSSLPDNDLPQADSQAKDRQATASAWKGLLGGRRATPLCRGHNEPCVMHTVKKAGPNQFRQFYVCARPSGSKTNPAARCEHFEWADGPKLKSAASLAKTN